MTEDLSPFLFLSTAALYILLSLAGEARHGYGIMQEIAKLSGNQYKVGPGTLYDNLDKLLDSELVQEAKRPSEISDPRRRYYELTAIGRQVLAADVDRLKSLVRQATSRLNSAPVKVSR
ncbi:MAG: PadR family transcriptional regulator [Terracidiphilus sp.]